MMKMIASLLFVLVLSGISPTEGGTLPADTPDGRFGTPCSGWGANTSIPLCSVPYARLIALPEKFQDRFVAITGFLVDEDGTLMLYPTREDYEAGVPFESICLFGDIPSEWREKAKKGVWAVDVTGTFDAKEFCPGEASLGILKNVRDITLIARHMNRNRTKL